jgi:Protein of unknown function (DUF2950)
VNDVIKHSSRAHRSSKPGSRGAATLASVAYFCALTLSCTSTAPRSQRTYETAENAVRSLVETVKAGNVDQLLEILGPDAQDLVSSADPTTARRNREVFNVAVAERWRLEDAGTNGKTLVIGNEDWPFPVPLVKDTAGWRFDTAAGKEEVLNRRIGRNELAVIRICRTYVAAQRLYAERGHDGQRAGLYASRFASGPGRENGLYWPTERGKKRSPLGDMVAQAAEEGRPIGQNGQAPSPFHGYYFKILTAQGASAPGGSKDYVVKGEFSGGFALVAWPAQYGVTGIMTFVVSQDGSVSEKDLGPETNKLAGTMTAYDPDASWSASQ